MNRHTRLRAVWVVCAVFAAAGRTPAGDLYNRDAIPQRAAALPRAAEIQSVSVHPERLHLRGGDDSPQLVVTARLAGGRIHDLTDAVRYQVGDPRILRVTSSGRVLPLADGQTEVIASFADRSVRIPATVEAVGASLPINFANQVVPVFTKLGCNSGGCHGKASGQNGFKLSLLGFEPEVDFNALVKEARGRRLFPSAPDHSLLLRKATGAVAHAGGKRMEVGSDEYRLVRRWIAAGAPYGKPTDPVVTRLSIYPDHRLLTRGARQQFATYAHYSDGSVEDVTRRAQYESNDTEVAVVDGSGVVRTLGMSGQAAVMARYQGHVTVFRAVVPLGQPAPAYDFREQTLVDQFTRRKWAELGIVPSDLCTDEQFIRRVTLDVTGTLPTPADVRAFAADTDPQKRDKLVDALVERPEYAYYFGNKWADILRVKRRQQPNRAQGTFAFHDWIVESLASDKPYDRFVREIYSASGDEATCPPTVWYKELQEPQQFVDDTAQVFLGLRMACAQCHHHPYEKWSQDDYWGLAAFFGRVGRKMVPAPGTNQGQPNQVLHVYSARSGGVVNKRTNQPALMKTLEGGPLQVAADEDPRRKLVDWMVDPKNPFLARAVANRYWAHFFGRGIVDPLDDMRVTNPPSNPELLDALARDFVEHGYSLKHLVRTICKSRTYQLSSLPNEFNKHDKQSFARFYPRRLTAEVLFDSFCQVTGSPADIGGLPQDRHAPRRAIMLPDESYPSYFLEVFGRPQRISACECERVSEANLAQALHLLNSDEVHNKLSRPGGRADLLAKDPRPDAEKVDELCLWAWAHRPLSTQLESALSLIQRNAQDKKRAYEDILWALINTKEFQFNQ